MVVLLAAGVVQPAVAGLLAAGAMVLLRVVCIEQAYRSISWTTVVLVAGLIPLSTAIEKTGAADKIAHVLITVVGNHGPYVLMIGLFLLIGALGQVISNTATALIMIPIALSAAAEIGVSPRPILMLMTVAAAASFLTPIATPANMMVTRAPSLAGAPIGCSMLGLGGSRGDGLWWSPVKGPDDTTAPGFSGDTDWQQGDAPQSAG